MKRKICFWLEEIEEQGECPLVDLPCCSEEESPVCSCSPAVRIADRFLDQVVCTDKSFSEPEPVGVGVVYNEPITAEGSDPEGVQILGYPITAEERDPIETGEERDPIEGDVLKGSTELSYSLKEPDDPVEIIDQGIPWIGDMPRSEGVRRILIASEGVDQGVPPEVIDIPVPQPVGGGASYPWNCITTIPAGSEGINTVNSDLPWSIKLTRVMVQYLGSDGLGSHMGPFLSREKVGLSFWYYSSGATIFRGKWSGNEGPRCPAVDPPPPTPAEAYVRYDQLTPGVNVFVNGTTWWPDNGYHGSYHVTRGTARSNAVYNTTQRQDPDGIPWLTPAVWNAAVWDGVPMNPCTNSLSAVKSFLFPNPNTLRGLRERFYEVNPFSDLLHPTVAEIDSWNIEIIKHFRRLLGLTNPVYPERSLYKRAQWASEARNEKRFILNASTGVWEPTCAGSSNQHCGATYLPACGEFDSPGVPGQNNSAYRFANEIN